VRVIVCCMHRKGQPKGRLAHEHSSRVGQAWDSQIKPIVDDFGYLVGSEFSRKYCVYCNDQQEVRVNADGAIACVECGTVYNQGKPFTDPPKNEAKSKMNGMHRFFKAIA
jgi:hypothetical protein